MLRKILYPLFLIAGIWLSACHRDNKKNKHGNDSLTIINDITTNSSAADLVENTTRIKGLETFSGLLTKADLDETLKKPGPFTIFAPTNEAFNKLPKEFVDKITGEKKIDITDLISSHIVAGLLRTGDLKDGQKLQTLSGEELIVSLKNNEPMINGVKISQQDILSANGVIHVIDEVILSPDQKHKL
jgi:uncharacterized surface protein with fasciclin (FAS1) repeats